MTNNKSNILYSKLDKFIKKYYKNLLIRGLLLALFIYLSYYLTIIILEYFNNFSIKTRTIIFYFSLTMFIATNVYFIVIPLFKLFKIGQRINYRQASEIIAKHFTNVKDKLINTLELENELKNPTFSNDLVLASIDKRIDELKPVPFSKAINLKSNYKYLKFLIPVFLIFVFIYFYSPNVIKESTQHIINYNTYFKPKMPFDFILQNTDLKVKRGDDFTVKLKIKGNILPDKVFISYSGNKFLMQKKEKSLFEYTFKNINNSIDFLFNANNFNSDKYKLKILEAPVILDFTLTADVPAYTGEKNIEIKNNGNITVPAGSHLKWDFLTSGTDSLFFTINDSINLIAKNNKNSFEINKTVYKSIDYSVNVKNRNFTEKKLISYRINVIPDLYPTIKVQSVQDSLSLNTFYFKGNISDDYGLTKLTFNYRDKSQKDSIKTVNIDINKNIAQEFYYIFDFGKLLANNQTIEYYFQVWDNDGINGPKSVKSTIFNYRKPSKEEIQASSDEKEKAIESNIKKSNKLIADIKKDVEKLQESLINKNSSKWEQTKQLQNIVQKQNELKQLLEKISQQNQQKNNLENEFLDQQKDIIEKQKQIEELMKNVLTDEIKKMMQELEELMKNFDKNKLNKLSEKLNTSYEDLSKQLDRNLEMLKQLKLEKELNQNIDKLEELAKKQDKLSNDIKNKKDLEKNKAEQKKQEQEFKKLTEDYKKLQEENKQLENPMNLDNFEQQKQEIEQNFEQTNQNLQNKKISKASKSQKKTSQNLQKMASQMRNMMNSEMQMKQGENIDNLRNILDNLTDFSFTQEDLMKKLKNTNNRDPQYVALVNKQNQLKTSFSVINDSLFALSKRVPQISSPIIKELSAIKYNMQETTDELEQRNITTANRRQQTIMTSANNLALLLSEILQQMQSQMKQQCKGNSQCNKPGQNSSISKMRQQQQSLKKQLESMLNQMKQGQKPGQKHNGMSEKLAKMLAQQEKFEQALNSLMNSNGLNPETQKKLNEIKKLMQENKHDIINKNINAQTLNRQNRIVTRLLEAENSDFKRGIDKKRKAEKPLTQKYSNPKDIFDKKQNKTEFDDVLFYNTLKLNKYYNQKYKQYLNNLNN